MHSLRDRLIELATEYVLGMPPGKAKQHYLHIAHCLLLSADMPPMILSPHAGTSNRTVMMNGLPYT